MKPLTYVEVVRSFDHAPLAASPAYVVLRQALSDLANESADLDPALTLAGFLDAVRDMAATAPYADGCERCDPDGYRAWWPHAVVREGAGLTGTYRCANGHKWTCWWSVDAAYMRIT